MSLRKPSKRDLVVGKIVDIYDGEGNLKGKARLLQRKPSRSYNDNLPYIRYEKKNNTQQPTCFFWSQERWLVEWTEHDYYRTGDKSCVMVHYFLSIGTDLDSRYDIIKDGHKGLEVDGLFVFMEETVLEVGPEGGYTEESIKALRRVMRAGNGALVLYTHSPIAIKERFELSKIPFRIFDFITTDTTFQEGIRDFLEQVDFDEYLVFTKDSVVNLPNTIKCPDGLKLKTNDLQRKR